MQVLILGEYCVFTLLGFYLDVIWVMWFLILIRMSNGLCEWLTTAGVELEFSFNCVCVHVCTYAYVYICMCLSVCACMCC